MSNVNNISFDAGGSGAITNAQNISGRPGDATSIIDATDTYIIQLRQTGDINFNTTLDSGININPGGNRLTFIPDPTTSAIQGQIVGLSTINGVAYNPGGGGSYPPDANFSTITMGTGGTIIFSDNTGYIETSGIYAPFSDDLTISASTGNNMFLSGGSAGGAVSQSLVSLLPNGSVVINNDNSATVPITDGTGLIISTEGQNITFPSNPSVTAGAGQIFNLSTINGSPYNPGGSYPPTANFSTITMNPTTGQIRANDIKNPVGNGNDFGISQESATANLNLTVKPSGGATAGEITINNAGSISFNEINAGSGVLVNPQGNTLTFLQTVGSVNQGQIVGLSTINSVAYPRPNFVDSFQIYVAPNGNNTTGDGSQQSPYLTIAQAIIKRATIANTTEVSIMLSSGTYTETFTLVRNTYLVGVQTGEARQPCNIVGAITLNDTTGTMGISGLEITGSVSMTGGGAVYTVFGCNITNTATAVNATAGTIFITECRISNTASATLISFSTLTIRDCAISTSGTGSCLSLASITTVRQCVLTSSSASTGASALVNYANTNLITFVLEFCRLEYTNATTDVTGNKTCVRFNGSGAVTASVSQCLLICEGAITGSPQIQCIQRTGAGAVVLAYGQLIAGATAHHIAPTIVKTQYTTVP
jgi:hypothetical protein